MRSKVLAAGQSQLICCDCGQDLSPAARPRRAPVHVGSMLLMSLFWITAIVLMVIKDHQRKPSLRDSPDYQLNSRRTQTQRSRALIIVPGLPASQR